MRTIRASEIGTFLYCRRAWWYQLQGVVSQNKTELAGGTQFHQRHGRSVMAAGLLRAAGWLLLFAAIGVLAAGLTLALLR
jgi:hypothetical protein